MAETSVRGDFEGQISEKGRLRLSENVWSSVALSRKRRRFFARAGRPDIVMITVR
jgi:hypothetical protein